MDTMMITEGYDVNALIETGLFDPTENDFFETDMRCLLTPCPLR